MIIELIFGMVGGLALFIYGMQLTSDALQKSAGDKLPKILELLTNKPIVGVVTGALITAIVQSSSATSVILIGLVNARWLIKLKTSYQCNYRSKYRHYDNCSNCSFSSGKICSSSNWYRLCI